MAEGERVFVAEVRPERRFTRAPAHYTEAGLVRRLEELGIRRPSPSRLRFTVPPRSPPVASRRLRIDQHHRAVQGRW